MFLSCIVLIIFLLSFFTAKQCSLNVWCLRQLTLLLVNNQHLHVTPTVLHASVIFLDGLLSVIFFHWPHSCFQLGIHHNTWNASLLHGSHFIHCLLISSEIRYSLACFLTLSLLTKSFCLT